MFLHEAELGQEEKVTFRKVTAIIRTDRTQYVLERLKVLGVPGMSLTRVKGYGEYMDFYSTDWCVSHVRVEMFVQAARVDDIVHAIMDEAHTGVAGDGIVAVLPVERLYHIRTGEESRNIEV